MTEYTSKHGIVSKPQSELYMGFVDLRNFYSMIPQDKVSQFDIKADYDTLSATVQGFTIGVCVFNRTPYERIDLVADRNSPLNFGISFHFDPTDVPGKTDFYIVVTAELNMMMKMMLGKKIQEGIDQIVDGLAAL